MLRGVGNINQQSQEVTSAVNPTDWKQCFCHAPI